MPMVSATLYLKFQVSMREFGGSVAAYSIAETLDVVAMSLPA
jgi:hypothetical protein